MNNYEKLEEKYYSSVEYEFSGKLVGYKKNVGVIGNGITVATELKLDSYSFRRHNQTVCFVGKFTPESLIFSDYLHRGYEENLFDSISIKSKERSVFYYLNGELVKEEYIAKNCLRSPDENWFKRKLEDEPGTIF